VFTLLTRSACDAGVDKEAGFSEHAGVATGASEWKTPEGLCRCTQAVDPPCERVFILSTPEPTVVAGSALPEILRPGEDE